MRVCFWLFVFHEVSHLSDVRFIRSGQDTISEAIGRTWWVPSISWRRCFCVSRSVLLVSSRVVFLVFPRFLASRFRISSKVLGDAFRSHRHTWWVPNMSCLWLRLCWLICVSRSVLLVSSVRVCFCVLRGVSLLGFMCHQTCSGGAFQKPSVTHDGCQSFYSTSAWERNTYRFLNAAQRKYMRTVYTSHPAPKVSL